MRAACRMVPRNSANRRYNCSTPRDNLLLLTPCPEFPGLSTSYQACSTTGTHACRRFTLVKLRQKCERLAQNQLGQGVVLVSDRRQSTAATYADIIALNLP